METGQSIGVFDSGLGGISVLREIVALLPQEDYIYYGDSGNAPYGVRPAAEIHALTMKGLEILISQGIKALVIACNTATSIAGEDIRRRYPRLPVIAIEPALKPAVLSCKNGTILVMATNATLKEDKFRCLMESYAGQAEIIKCPCPGLVEFIERGELDSPAVEEFLRNRFAEFSGKNITGIVLGCTHYPFVRSMIQKVTGSKVRIFDGGAGTARQLARRLKTASLLKSSEESGSIKWLNSSPNPEIINMSRHLFRA
jgi:glutamate racemase